MESTVCPLHEIDVRKRGYDVGDGYKRCPVSEDNPKTGVCLFTRQTQG